MKAISTLKPYWLLYLLALLPFFSLAQDGSLDPGFANGGKLSIDFPQASRAQDVVQQPDGKLIVVGTGWGYPYQLYVVRLNPDGSFDNSFGNAGKVIIPSFGVPAQGKNVALQNDGKIVIVSGGSVPSGPLSVITIIRLNPDGSLDLGPVYFRPANSGAEGVSLAIQPDNRMVIGATSYNGIFREGIVFRLNPDGSYDNSFAEKRFASGGKGNSPQVIRLQKDGKVVVGIQAPGPSGRYDFVIVRLNPDGSFDNSFNQNGTRLIDFAGVDDDLYDLVIQEDCKILVAGVAGQPGGGGTFALARLNADGIPDNSFAFLGKATYSIPGTTGGGTAYAVDVQRDGKIIVTGSAGSDFDILRLHNDGSFDQTFGNGGWVRYDFDGNRSDQAYDGLIQNDGKIVAVGTVNGTNNQATYTSGIIRLNNTVKATAPYTCNYTVQPNFTIVGDAKKISTAPECYELTTNWLSQIGAIWYNTTTDFNLLTNFTIAADINFGAQDNGADGVAFVLQPVGTTVLGARGGGLGYMGISPSFVVEFDTYHNDEPWFDVGDPIEDHIGFMKNGSPYHQGPQSGALLPPIPLPVNIEDGQYHHVEFSWNATTKTMSVSFLGNTYSYTGDIANTIFEGYPFVHFGFTAATGSPLFNVTQNVQRVCNITLIANTTTATSEKGITAHPNPTTESILLKLEKDLKGQGKLSILNSSGTVIGQQPLTLHGKGQIIPVDLSKAPRGMYLIQIVSESGTVTQKVVKQ